MATVTKIAPKREGQWEEIERLENKIASILAEMETSKQNIVQLQQMLEDAQHKFYCLRWELVEAIEEYQSAISPWKEGA